MTLQYASEYRAAARNMLRGRWVEAVIVGLVASLLGGTASGSVSTGSSAGSASSSSGSIDLSQGVHDFESLFESIISNTVIITVLLVAIAISLVVLFIGSVVRVGYARYNMKLVSGEPSSVGELFYDFHRFGTCFVMNLVQSLLIFVGMLLFIVPGVILTYSYAMAHYILAEHPDYTATQALSESRQMMKGHKFRLFCLQISFIGWAILTAFTCGIGSLFLTPYMEAANAIFYLELAGDYYGTAR